MAGPSLGSGFGSLASIGYFAAQMKWPESGGSLETGGLSVLRSAVH